MRLRVILHEDPHAEAEQWLAADGEPDADKKYLLVAQRWMRRAGTLASALLKEQSWADQPLLAEQNKT